MSTLQGESFYFHHGWHFLRADAFPMAKAVDAHRDAEGHAFYEADYRETGWQPVTLPHTFNDEDLFRDRIQDGGSGQRRMRRTSSPLRPTTPPPATRRSALPRPPTSPMLSPAAISFRRSRPSPPTAWASPFSGTATTSIPRSAASPAPCRCFSSPMSI